MCAAAPPHNVNPTNPVMPGSFDLLASVFLSLSSVQRAAQDALLAAELGMRALSRLL